MKQLISKKKTLAMPRRKIQQLFKIILPNFNGCGFSSAVAIQR